MIEEFPFLTPLYEFITIDKKYKNFRIPYVVWDSTIKEELKDTYENS